MKKIMFNDRFGLTNAVLSGRKTMTRRIINGDFETIKSFSANYEWIFVGETKDGDSVELKPAFEVGEVVAVAQPYKSIPWNCIPINWLGKVEKMSGYTNKMFVKAEYMPEQIRIMSVNAQRIQDICDEDCIKEGVYHECYQPYYTYFGSAEKNCPVGWNNPKGAFADLFDKVCGRGTWKRNPWVWGYEFELVKEKRKMRPKIIYVEITDGKNLSIVGENYPFAEVYVKKADLETEIEKYKEETGIGLDAYSMGFENGKAEICNRILSFINTMLEEPVKE